MGQRQRLSAEDISCLLERFKAGQLVSEIAKSLDRPERSVIKALRKLGHEVRDLEHPSAAEVADWVVRYNKGFDTRQLARAANRSEKTVKTYLANAGVKFRDRRGSTGPTGVSPAESALWRRQYVVEEKPIHEIALLADRADKTVRRQLVALGIELRPMGKRPGFRFPDRFLGRVHFVEINDAVLDQWTVWVDQGWSLGRIQKETGVSRQTIARRLGAHFEAICRPRPSWRPAPHGGLAGPSAAP